MNWIFIILSLSFLYIKFVIIVDKKWFINYRKINKNYIGNLHLVDLNDNYPLALFINEFLYLIFLFVTFLVFNKLETIIISLLILDIIKGYILRSKMNDQYFYVYSIINLVIDSFLIFLIIINLIFL